jgi:sulfite oxidase
MATRAARLGAAVRRAAAGAAGPAGRRAARPAGAVLRASAAAGAAAAGFVLHARWASLAADAAGDDDDAAAPPVDPASLPIFTRAQVAAHASPATGVWVTYGAGVYDVTDFVALHPGGAKLLMAAGGAVDAFWRVYPQHKSPHVLEILERHRIGSLDPAEAAAEAAAAAAAHSDANDPYAADPPRSPLLVARAAKPYNAEPPLALLADSYVTPTELLFVRHHLPVPQVDLQTYALEVHAAPPSTAGAGAGAAAAQPPLKLSLADLQRRFPKASVTAVLACAGNRRAHMSASSAGPTRGLAWDGGAIGNVVWGGARLRDVLLAAGVRPEDVGRHVQHIVCNGLDREPGAPPPSSPADLSSHCYSASIPADVALNPAGDVLLAYELNGAPLPADHGGPVRLVVPGVVGARQVKWVGSIVAGPDQATSLWQAKDYRVFPPSTNWDNVRYEGTLDMAPPIQDVPVTSAICDPPGGSTLPPGVATVPVKGYAWAGGGRGIARVDVSADGGASWVVADVVQRPPDPSPSRSRSWGWTLWSADVPLPPAAVAGGSPGVELVCRAVDVAHNTQPADASTHWNYRGLLANAWHRVRVSVPPPAEAATAVPGGEAAGAQPPASQK